METEHSELTRPLHNYKGPSLFYIIAPPPRLLIYDPRWLLELQSLHPHFNQLEEEKKVSTLSLLGQNTSPKPHTATSKDIFWPDLTPKPHLAKEIKKYSLYPKWPCVQLKQKLVKYSMNKVIGEKRH